MSGPPPWLRGRLERALDKLDHHPDPGPALRAVARRHAREQSEVLLIAGAGEAFALLAQVLRPVQAVAVQPDRVRLPEAAPLVLAPPYVLDPAQVPDEADLLVVGHPSATTGVLQPRLPELCRAGRHVVVDEGWGDAAPGSLAALTDLPGLVVVRSLSRTWGVPGLRAGYLLGAPDLVASLRRAQQPHPLSTLALTALETCSARGPVRSAEKEAAVRAEQRDRLADRLRELGVDVVPGSQAPLLLCSVPGREDVRQALGDSPAVQEMDAGHWRIEVHDDHLVDVLQDAGGGGSGP